MGDGKGFGLSASLKSGDTEKIYAHNAKQVIGIYSASASYHTDFGIPTDLKTVFGFTFTIPAESGYSWPDGETEMSSISIAASSGQTVKIKNIYVLAEPYKYTVNHAGYYDFASAFTAASVNDEIYDIEAKKTYYKYEVDVAGITGMSYGQATWDSVNSIAGFINKGSTYTNNANENYVELHFGKTYKNAKAFLVQLKKDTKTNFGASAVLTDTATNTTRHYAHNANAATGLYVNGSAGYGMPTDHITTYGFVFGHDNSGTLKWDTVLTGNTMSAIRIAGNHRVGVSATIEAIYVVAEDIKLELTGYSPVLTNNMSIRFQANASLFGNDGPYTNPYITVKDGNGAEKTINSYTTSQDGKYYVFEYSNISPAKMGTEFTATLCATKDGQSVSSQEYTTSLKGYGEQILDSNDEKLTALAKALLNYGAYAEMYHYEKDTSDVNNALNSTGDNAVASPFDVTDGSINYGGLNRGEAPTNEVAAWTSASLTLNESIAVNFFFTLNEGTELNGLAAHITYGKNNAEKTIDLSSLQPVETTGGNAKYKIRFDELSAEDFSSKISVVIKNSNNEEVSRKLDYSILDYAYSVHNSENADNKLKNLIYAMVEYIAAVDNYVGNESKLNGMSSIYSHFGFFQSTAN